MAEIVAWLCGAALACCVWPQFAAAEPGPPAEVSLSFSECPTASYDAGALGALVRVELQSLGVARVHSELAAVSSGEPGQLAMIRLSCGSKPATLMLELSDLVSGNRVSRELEITDVDAAARPRALSITIATLLESSWSLLAARPARLGAAELPPRVRDALRRRLGENLPAPAPPPLPAADELPPAFRPPRPPPPAVPSLVQAALGVRSFPARGSAVLGLDLALLPSLGSNVYAGLNLEAMYGVQQVRDSSGPVADLEVVWLCAGAGLFVASESEPRLMLGPIVRGGYVRVIASTDDSTLVARDAGHWLFSFGVAASLRASLGAGWDGVLGADLGYVPGGITFLANEGRVLSLAGVTLGVQIGVGRAF